MARSSELWGTKLGLKLKRRGLNSESRECDSEFYGDRYGITTDMIVTGCDAIYVVTAAQCDHVTDSCRRSDRRSSDAKVLIPEFPF